MDSTMLKYLLQRAAQDDQIIQGERLQRGELSPQEIEELRTSNDPDAAVLYELYRPLDDLEKRRLLRGKSRPTVWYAAAAAAAAILVVIGVQKPLQPMPVQVSAHSDVSGVGKVPHMLGSAETGDKPLIDIGGCTRFAIMPTEDGAKLPADATAQAYFQNGKTIVPWEVELQYDAVQRALKTKETCARVPSEGLGDGDWQLAVIYGKGLPKLEQAAEVLRGGWVMPWTRWTVARQAVRLQSRK